MTSLTASRIAGNVRFALVGGLVALLTGPVAALQPEDVVIQSHTERGCPGPASCVFVATGAVVDGGAVTTESVQATAQTSPTVGTAQYVRTFHGLLGTLTIRLNSMIRGTDDPTLFDEQGHWVIVSGTGAYSGLLGQGTESGVRDFANQSLDAVYTGQVH